MEGCPTVLLSFTSLCARNLINHKYCFCPLTGKKDASTKSRKNLTKVHPNTFYLFFSCLARWHSSWCGCHLYNCHDPRKKCKEAAGISFRHAAHVLTNMGVMKGTQVQMHINIIIRADKKRLQQETTDMSQLANNNFLILELFSSI